MSMAHSITTGRVWNDAEPAEEILRALKADGSSPQLLNSGSMHGGKKSPHMHVAQQHKVITTPRPNPYETHITVMANSSGSLRPGSISAAATAGIAARAQADTTALIQQRLQQAVAARTAAEVNDSIGAYALVSSSLPASQKQHIKKNSEDWSKKLQTPQLALHKLTVGAPEEWKVASTVDGIVPSPSAALPSSKTSARVNTETAATSARPPLPGQLTAPATAKQPAAVFKAPAVPSGTLAPSPSPPVMKPVQSALKAAAGDTALEDPSMLDAIIAQGYDMVGGNGGCSASKGPGMQSIETAATAAAAADGTSLEASAYHDGVVTVQAKSPVTIKLASSTAVTRSRAEAAAADATASTHATQLFNPGHIIHYRIRLPGQNSRKNSSSSTDATDRIVLELELLGCFGTGDGELYHVRLRHDVPEEAAAADVRPGQQQQQTEQGSSQTAVANSNTSSSSEEPSWQYKKGQEFALKLRDRKLPMTVDPVTALRKMMRKHSCLRYAQQLKSHGGA